MIDPLIDLLHARGVVFIGSIVFQGGHVLLVLNKVVNFREKMNTRKYKLKKNTYSVGSGIVGIIKTETELDHAVDASGVDLGVFQREAGGEEGGFVKKHDQVLEIGYFEVKYRNISP